MDIKNLLENIGKLKFSFPELSDDPLFLVDFFIVILIFYWIYTLLKNTRAVRILYGLFILALLMYVSSLLHLALLNWVLGAVLTVILVAIPIVFQPELRNALERIGRTGLNPHAFKNNGFKYLEEILETLKIMSKKQIGGIIAIQRKTGLGDFIKTGILLNADISKELLLSCFIPESSLHDGAIIISDNKIIAASCILPLSSDDSVAKLGTRHKAALGLSEQTDAVVIVVSGTTGMISIAHEGFLFRGVKINELEKKLRKIFENNKINLKFFKS